MLNRFFILSMAMILLLSCGDDDSGKSPIQSEFGESSSGEINPSSSDKVTDSVERESSSSSKKIALSSSTPRSDKKSSSSSSKEKKSSSSSKVETSSSKKSSSSSSTPRKDNKSSSSSVKNPEPGEGSSSSESSSSGIVTQNSSSSSENPGPIENTSSSEESSSSLNPVESSSSEISSSSSPALNSIYDAENNTLTDLRDGQVYKTVTIGLQVWMAENLNYIPDDTIGSIWAGKTLCGGGEWKTKEEGNCEIYGRLYEEDFASIKNYTLVICPDGWSLPTKTQYQDFISSLGGDAANKMKIDNSIYWDVDEVTNQSGFSAVPSGYYSGAKGFNPIYEQGTSVVALFFDRKSQTGNSTVMIVDNEIDYMQFGDKQFAAIRCIKK